MGGRPLALSSAWFRGDTTGVSAWGLRAEKAGGTLANLLLGVCFLIWLRRTRQPPVHLFYFAWLSMTINLLQGGGYLMVSPLAGFGDWKGFLAGLESPWAWRLGLTALGLAISFAALLTARRLLEPLLGREPHQRSRRALWLCWLPYLLVGGLIFSIAAAFNPGGRVYMLTSAAAHLGGTAWLCWLPAWTKQPGPNALEPPLTLPRHAGWLIAGGIAVIVCIFVLGPSIPLSRASP